jgi:hypothetical protein
MTIFGQRTFSPNALNITLMRRLLYLLFVVGLVSCNRHSSTDTSISPGGGAEAKTISADAKPFPQKVYRTIDGRRAVTIVSDSELELRERGTNLIGKYTKQDDTLRVVANILGSPQALYFKIVQQGLRADDGTVFFSPAELDKTLEVMRLAQERKEEERRQIAAEIAESRKRTKEIATFALTNDNDWTPNPDKATITDVSIILHIPKGGQVPNGDTVTMNFGDLCTLRHVQKHSKFRFDGFEFYVAQEVGDGGQSGEMLICQTQAEAQNARNAIVEAYNEWVRKFPHAVPRLNVLAR